MNIIAKLSFWITEPANETKESTTTAFEQVIREALALFKRDGYVEKLKANITSEALPSNNQDLLAFMYNQIAHI
jgi:hypothetical protein